MLQLCIHFIWKIHYDSVYHYDYVMYMCMYLCMGLYTCRMGVHTDCSTYLQCTFACTVVCSTCHNNTSNMCFPANSCVVAVTSYSNLGKCMCKLTCTSHLGVQLAFQNAFICSTCQSVSCVACTSCCALGSGGTLTITDS